MHRVLSISAALMLLAATVALTSVSTASAGVATPDCATQVNDTPELLMDCVTIDGVRAHQQAFQDHADANDGTREASSPGYQASVDYVVEALTAAGYTPVIQSVEYSFFEELSDAMFAQTAPNTVDYVDQTDFDVMRFSGSDDVSAAVTPVDLSLDDRDASTSGCEPEDFDGFPAGDLALIQRGACSFAQKAENAEAAGAVGAIIFNQGNTPEREGLLFGTLGDPGINIPVIGATTQVGIDLSDNASADLSVDATSEIRESFNVLAETAGGDPDNVVMAGAHLDSVAAGPGIQDNGSGSAAVLEVAVQMANVDPVNKVRFAWWGAEEAGLVGSDTYVFGLSDAELAQIALYLNFDMIGSPNFVRFIYDGDGSAFGLEGPGGSMAIEKFFEDFYDERALASEPTEISFRSDYAAFFDSGIPFGGLFTGAEGIKSAEEVAIYGGVEGEQYDQCYHQACDTFDNISLDVFDLNSDAVAASVITYAMDATSVTDSQVGLVIGNADNPTRSDRLLMDLIHGAGYDVTLLDDDAIADEADVPGDIDTLVVASSVKPANIPAWMADTDRGIVSLEGFSFDDLGMATKSGERASGKNWIRITDAAVGDPLAAGFTSYVGVFSAPVAKVNFGDVGGDAHVIATPPGSSSKATYFAYDTGDLLADGATPAPARRVGFPSTFQGTSDLNGQGQALFGAALDWAAG